MQVCTSQFRLPYPNSTPPVAYLPPVDASPVDISPPDTTPYTSPDPYSVLLIPPNTSPYPYTLGNFLRWITCANRGTWNNTIY